MATWKIKSLLRASTIALALTLTWQTSVAGPLRDRMLERRAAQAQRQSLEGDDAALLALAKDIRIAHNISYGSDELQRFDAYAPMHAQEAPVIFMVHGGAWRLGDKAARSVIENKVAHWVPKGFIVVSVNYRMLPKTDPIEQAKDVARALATAQDKAALWGGDRSRFILMGHSAGAHLVALLAASPTLLSDAGAAPPLGTVALDSAALDVVQIMQTRHMRLYDDAFGNDSAYWKAASPFYALTKAGPPILAVCSTQRNDSCPQARRFVARATSLGTQASVLGQDLSHEEINQRLGEMQSYTKAVDAFLRTLEPVVAKLLD